jgi:hypothetical protein
VTANGIPVNMVMMTVNGRTYPRQVNFTMTAQPPLVPTLPAHTLPH